MKTEIVELKLSNHDRYYKLSIVRNYYDKSGQFDSTESETIVDFGNQFKTPKEINEFISSELFKSVETAAINS